MNSRTSMAQRDEVIRRTVYVSDIDHQVTHPHPHTWIRFISLHFRRAINPTTLFRLSI